MTTVYLKDVPLSEAQEAIALALGAKVGPVGREAPARPAQGAAPLDEPGHVFMTISDADAAVIVESITISSGYNFVVARGAPGFPPPAWTWTAHPCARLWTRCARAPASSTSSAVRPWSSA